MPNPTGVNQYTKGGRSLAGAASKAALKNKLAALETRMNHFTTKAPLKMKAAVANEIKQIKASLAHGSRKAPSSLSQRQKTGIPASAIPKKVRAIAAKTPPRQPFAPKFPRG